MNPEKKQKLLIFLFIGLGLIGAIVSIYFYSATEGPEYLFMSIIFFVMFGLYVWKLSKIETPETEVEFSEGILHAKNYLEKELKITIPKNYEVYDTTDTGETYKTVLFHADKYDGGTFYYPIEFYKKWAINNNGDPFVKMGDSTGKVTKNVDVVKTYLIKSNNKKANFNMEKIEAMVEAKLSAKSRGTE